MEVAESKTEKLEASQAARFESLREREREHLPLSPIISWVGMMPGGLDRPPCPGERERERERESEREREHLHSPGERKREHLRLCSTACTVKGRRSTFGHFESFGFDCVGSQC